MKQALKPFYDRIYGMDDDALETLEALAYAEARVFFKSFSSEGTAPIVRQAMGG